jgi:hypothetical protein
MKICGLDLVCGFDAVKLKERFYVEMAKAVHKVLLNSCRKVNKYQKFMNFYFIMPVDNLVAANLFTSINLL